MNNLLKKVKEFFIKIKELLSKTKPFFEKIGEFLSPVKAFYKKHFDILNPIVVLTVICIVIAAALSVTNSLTASRIAEMEFSKQELVEWVAISFSRGSSQPRDQTRVSRIAGRFFTV